MARVTRALGRTAAVGLPTWLVLLLLLPQTGLGPMPCLFLASALAAGLVVLLERRRGRAEAGEAPGGPRARRPMSALGGAGIALGAVAVLAYVVFVVRAT